MNKDFNGIKKKLNKPTNVQDINKWHLPLDLMSKISHQIEVHLYRGGLSYILILWFSTFLLVSVTADDRFPGMAKNEQSLL